MVQEAIPGSGHPPRTLPLPATGLLGPLAIAAQPGGDMTLAAT